MAITRMQQPRQMYGLGSFVKKAVGKVTKPFTKVAKKIVPKEIAGIMRVAAPFLPPGYREAAYLLGTAKQTGRISPIDLALAAAPTLNQKFGKTDAGFFAEQFPKSNQFLFGAPSAEITGAQLSPNAPNLIGETITRPATEGILGSGGKMFQFGSDKGGFLDNIRGFRDQTKLGSLLLEGDKGTFSKSKIAGLGIGTLSLIQNSKTPDEAGTALAAATGNSDDYERGRLLFSQLTPELFEVPEQFRMNVKDGGRIKFNQGTRRSSLPGPKAGLGSLGGMEDKEFKFDAQEFMINKYNEDGTKPNVIAEGSQGDDKIFVIETPNFGTMTITMDQYLENFGIPERKIKTDILDGLGTVIINTSDGLKLMDTDGNLKYVGKDNKADGGMMRTNYAMGSDDDDKPVLPEDPTEPINPFAPKPIKPLGDMKMAEFDIDEGIERLSQARFNKPYDDLDPLEQELIIEIMKGILFGGKDSKANGGVIKMAEFDLKDYMEEFERVFPEMIEKRGTQEYKDMLEDYFRGLASKDKKGIMVAKEGGRANLALGTRPTEQETGLGGLPIEADMRYTGGFMPYGAKEKADDVPARLSKNEFVFTADAVRAAGGGSVNEGAKKMYQTMKKLEAKPEAKGMTA